MGATYDGWEESAEAWVQFVDEGDQHREFLLDPVMLGLLADVAGKDVLDVGCGEGRFSRMLASMGARVVGIDPTESLVASARGRGGGPRYEVCRAEKLPFPDCTFDYVVCYLVLIDIKDFRRAIAEIARVLKPGGQIVVSNLTSFTTASGTGWFRDSAGRKLHFPVDDYNQERGDVVRWRSIEVVNWHRPLSAYMKAFLGQGLRLLYFDEPVPSEEAVRERPDLIDIVRVPGFLVMVWEKG